MKTTPLVQTLTALAACLPLAGQAAPALSFPHHNDPKNTAAMGAILDAYMRSLSRGDEPAFEALLLNQQVPFMGTARRG